MIMNNRICQYPFVFSVTLDEETNNRLARLQQEAVRDKTEICRTALKEYLDRLEGKK